MPNDTLVREENGTEVPLAGTYTIDAAHSTVGFSVRHLGLSKVKGRFESFQGDVVVAPDPGASRTSVRIDTASFDTGSADRDGHVKSADFLDVEVYPSMTFESTAVRQDGRRWALDGALTIKDVTLPVTLDVDFDGAGPDPWGRDPHRVLGDHHDRARGLRPQLEPGARDRRCPGRQDRHHRPRRPGRPSGELTGEPQSELRTTAGEWRKNCSTSRSYWYVGLARADGVAGGEPPRRTPATAPAEVYSYSKPVRLSRRLSTPRPYLSRSISSGG